MRVAKTWQWRADEINHKLTANRACRWPTSGRRAQVAARAAVAERLYRAAFLARGDPGPGAGGPRPDLDPAEELALWTSIPEVAAPSRVWIYDYGQVFLLLLAQIIALAATFGTVYLRDIVQIE